MEHILKEGETYTIGIKCEAHFCPQTAYFDPDENYTQELEKRGWIIIPLSEDRTLHFCCKKHKDWYINYLLNG